jgi:hypothetical protein
MQKPGSENQEFTKKKTAPLINNEAVFFSDCYILKPVSF